MDKCNFFKATGQNISAWCEVQPMHTDKIIWFFQIEMMSESIDETLDKDEAEEETEELTNQVQLFIIHHAVCLFPNCIFLWSTFLIWIFIC